MSSYAANVGLIAVGCVGGFVWVFHLYNYGVEALKVSFRYRKRSLAFSCTLRVWERVQARSNLHFFSCFFLLSFLSGYVRFAFL